MRDSSTGASRIEPLGARHDRAGFCCGVPELDVYIWNQAGQDLKRRLAAVHVLTIDGRAIAGYYTLSANSIDPTELPPELARKLPQLPVPATLLGRMAVSLSMQRQGLGEFLLLHALETALQASMRVASWAFIVDAKAGAREFYLKHSFIPMVDPAERLFLPMKSIEALFHA